MTIFTGKEWRKENLLSDESSDPPQFHSILLNNHHCLNKCPPSQHTHIRPPNSLNGSNPDDLQPFLLQCQLTFNSYPQQFSTDESKVFFTISHMKRMALEWFEQGIMSYNLLHTPVWHSSWKDFIIELHTNFGPANPIGMAEAKLCHLCMNHNVRLMDYLVWFNTLTACVGEKEPFTSSFMMDFLID